MTYESAHLEGAASEVAVRSSHLVLTRPEAAAEVHRILRLHLGAPEATPAFAIPAEAIAEPATIATTHRP